MAPPTFLHFGSVVELLRSNSSTVSASRFADEVASCAPARLGVARSERRGRYGGAVAAIAVAQPHDAPRVVSLSELLHHDQPPKAHAGHVHRFTRATRTPARLGSTIHERGCLRDALFAARAQALPIGVGGTLAVEAEHGESIDNHAGEITPRAFRFASVLGRHAGTRQCLRRFHAGLHSLAVRRARNAEVLAPLDNELGHAVNGDWRSRIALVSVLLSTGGPLAIVWRVRAIVVFAIQRVLGRRTRSHVQQEIGELSPAFAQCDSSSAVITPVGVFFAKAALSDAAPNAVFRGHRAAASSSVFQANARAVLAPAVNAVAPARDGVAAREVVGWHVDRVAAVAPTSPRERVADARRRFAQGGETPVALVSPIQFDSHNHVYNTVTTEWQLGQCIPAR